MPGLSDVEKLLPNLSAGEMAQVLKWVVQQLGDSFPGIDASPDVCGGEPCIVGARIPVWILEQSGRLGASEQAHFLRLHLHRSRGHSGIVACTVDSDFSALARRIHAEVAAAGEMKNTLTRVNRSD